MGKLLATFLGCKDGDRFGAIGNIEPQRVGIAEIKNLASHFERNGFRVVLSLGAGRNQGAGKSEREPVLVHLYSSSFPKEPGGKPSRPLPICALYSSRDDLREIREVIQHLIQ